MDYAYVLGLVDRLSSPLLEPFVDGAAHPCCRVIVSQPRVQQLSFEGTSPDLSDSSSSNPRNVVRQICASIRWLAAVAAGAPLQVGTDPVVLGGADIL